MSQTEKKRSSRSSTNENVDSKNGSRHNSKRINYGGSISDIEADDTENYRKIAKKLARDKSELKDKLRRLLDEVESNSKEHRIELEKTQDYFQDQINDLIHERDQAHEETEKIREQLTKQKEMSEKRKEPQVIKRLENTISALQERLSKQNEERNDAKYPREEELMKNVSELQEALQKTKEACVKQINELHLKEQVIYKIKKDKDEEIAKITADKNKAIFGIQNIKEQLEKRSQDLDKHRDTQIILANKEIENIRADYEMKHNEFIKTGKNLLDENKKDFECKLSALENKNKLDIESLEKKHKKIVQSLTSENTRKTDLYNHDVRKQGEEYKKTIDTLKAEISTLKLNKDKLSGDSEEIIRHLKEQIIELKETMKKLQDNSQTINNEYINNLNKQKELTDKEVFAKNQNLAHYERQLKKIAEDSLERINNAERKAKLIEDEKRDLNSRYIAIKTSAEKHDQMMDNIRKDNQILRERYDKILQKYCQAQFAEQKALMESQHKKVDLENMVKDNEELKSKISGFTNNLLSLQNHTKTIQTEADRNASLISVKDKEINFLNKTLNNTTNELLRIKKAFTEELQQKLGEAKIDKEKQLVESEKRIAVINGTLQKMERVLVDLQQNLNNVTAERDKYKVSLNSVNEKEKLLNEDIRKLQEEMGKQKINFESLIERLNTESKAYKQSLEIFKVKESDYLKNREQLESLKHAMATMKSMYDSMETKITEEKNIEIAKLVDKLTQNEQIIAQNEQKTEKIRQEFIGQINEVRKFALEHKNKLDIIATEKLTLQTQLDMSERKLSALQAEYANSIATLRVKQKQVEDREAEIKRTELEMRNAPPKLMDPSIRKARDDALANLRQSKIELTRAKDEAIQFNQKLIVTEGLIKDLEREKQFILKSQSDLKETFVNNLNQQQEKHEKEMTEKTQRIKELEKMLTDKIKSN
jgi:chromosome segregation protein